MTLLDWRIAFAPVLPWLWIGLLAIIAVLACLPALRRIAPGGILRPLSFLLLLGILTGPAWLAETRRTLPDIALLLVDQSQSMALGGRAAMATRAAAALAATAGDIIVQTVAVPAAGDGGTALFAALHNTTAAIPAAQLAGVIAITDGEITDPPTTWPSTVPLTSLITAAHEETDRELRLLDTPAYGLTGQSVKLRVEVLDHGVSDNGTLVPITVTADGETLARQNVPIGVPVTLALPVRHAGANIIMVATAPLAGEVSTINNQDVFTLSGIRHRLNILLVSGSPDLGERSWRLLLKSDAATQLVHFTILRTPGEAIDADPADLALVPFPVDRLFQTDIDKFDLIILDRFDANSLLPDRYLANIANYVRNGGALLTELGPEFETDQSLALSSLGPILPAQLSDPGTITQSFSPLVTPRGARHPVTAPFAGIRLAPWYRMEASTQIAGDVLMTGANGAPLLILGNAGSGRIGMLLSDQFWLWTRGGAHAGPALPLLRRIVHWLLREPALEAEALSASLNNGRLVIDRQTLGPAAPSQAIITAPDGATSELTLTPAGAGRYQASLPAPTPGVWKVTQGNFTAYAASPPDNPQEYRDLAATAATLRPLAATTIWLGRTPPPPLAALIHPRHASAVTSTRQVPLLPPLPTTLLALILLAAAWWRESR